MIMPHYFKFVQERYTVRNKYNHLTGKLSNNHWNGACLKVLPCCFLLGLNGCLKEGGREGGGMVGRGALSRRGRNHIKRLAFWIELIQENRRQGKFTSDLSILASMGMNYLFDLSIFSYPIIIFSREIALFEHSRRESNEEATANKILPPTFPPPRRLITSPSLSAEKQLQCFIALHPQG